MRANGICTALVLCVTAIGRPAASAEDDIGRYCGLVCPPGGFCAAWHNAEWRLLCRDRCERPQSIFAWPGSERTYLDGTQDVPLASDRPDFTEASITVGYRRVQVEMGYTYIQDNAAVDRSAHSFPETLYRIGMFAEWFELRIAWNYGVNLNRDNVVSNIFDGGQDLYLGIKLNLTEQDGWLPEMALAPQMNVPTGHDDFSSDEVEPGVNWLYGWDVTEKLGIGGSTQVNRTLDEADVFYTEWADSITANYFFTEKFGMYIEWFGLFPAGSAVELPQLYADGGFMLRPHKNLQLDFRAGVGLNDAADDFFAGAGSVFRF